ncbi:ion channel [Roseovarius tibetensis]|uniref:ion channel n=1 Tax=Roseovarius tibetensis TaxID=2685897 RepID=UPI003D7F53F1
MTAFIILAVAALLISATVLVHYEALRMTGRLIRHLPIRPRQRVLVVIFACFAAHLVEIILYAAAIAALHQSARFGGIEGQATATALDFFYFSITSFTTLGIGDVYPEGPLRILAGIESLNGFLLITWSASFTYLVMRRHWHPDLDD